MTASLITPLTINVSIQTPQENSHKRYNSCWMTCALVTSSARKFINSSLPLTVELLDFTFSLRFIRLATRVDPSSLAMDLQLNIYPYSLTPFSSPLFHRSHRTSMIHPTFYVSWKTSRTRSLTQPSLAPLMSPPYILTSPMRKEFMLVPLRWPR